MPVNKRLKIILAIFSIIIILLGLLDGDYSVLVVFPILWFLIAPYLANFADENKYNPDIGFTIGLFFGLFGIFAYWIYDWMMRGKKLEVLQNEVQT